MKKCLVLLVTILAFLNTVSCQWSNVGMPAFSKIYASVDDTIYAGYSGKVYKGTGDGSWLTFVDSTVSVIYVSEDDFNKQVSLNYQKPNGTWVNQIHQISENRIINFNAPFNRFCSIYGAMLGTKANNNPFYFSSDTGQTWQTVSLPWPYGGRCIIKDSVVIVTSQSPVQSDGEMIYLSKDYGQTFAQVAHSGWWLEGGIYFFENRIYYSNGTHLFRSNDLGVTWQEISFNGFTFASLAYKNGVLLCLTGYQGISASLDYGDTWFNFSEGLDFPFESGRNIAITNNYYFVTFWDGSFWKRPISELVAIQNTANNTFSVLPNPATDQLLITFTTPCIAAKAEVYSISGQLLLSEPLTVSGNKAKIMLEKIPTGMYVLRIIQDGAVMQKKFLKM